MIAPPSPHTSGGFYLGDIPPADEWPVLELDVMRFVEAKRDEQKKKARTTQGPFGEQQTVDDSATGKGASGYLAVALARAVIAIRFAAVGERNNTLVKEAFSISRLPWPGSERKEVLEQLISAGVGCGLSREEATDSARRAWAAGEDAPRRDVPRDPPGPDGPANETPPPDTRQDGIDTQFGATPLTDAYLGELFAAKHKTDTLYCYRRGWHVWQGSHWAFDGTDADSVRTRAVQVARDIRTHAVTDTNLSTEAREALVKFSIRSESVSKTDAMVKMARPYLGRKIDDLDRDNWALNTLSGTYYIRHDDLRPHNPSDYITTVSPVRFTAGAKCPLWTQFLSRIFESNGPLIRYIQRAVGYSLTGSTREQCFFVLHGVGANGKSTFLRVILHMLGGLGYEPRFDSFLYQKGPRQSTDDRAHWIGKRLLATSEANSGARFDEASLKMMTGGEKITARHLYQDEFSYTPTFKLWLACNTLPRIVGTDEGIWRRIMTIPFNVQIPADQQDPDLPAKLLEESEGILQWAIEGCHDWLERGLCPPQEVYSATSEYRTSEDSLSRFFGEYADFKPELYSSAEIIRREYEAWCHSTGEYIQSPRVVSDWLKKNGCRREKVKNAWRWVGIFLESGCVSSQNSVGNRW
jgi:putative DNA primase/helicase